MKVSGTKIIKQVQKVKTALAVLESMVKEKRTEIAKKAVRTRRRNG